MDLGNSLYRTNPDAASFAIQLISDIVTGPFMNGLVQYGIGRGSVAGSVVIDTDSNNPAPAALDESQAQAQLIRWIQSGNVSPAPSVNETNLLYFIFPLTTTNLTLTDGTTGFCGYHKHGKDNNDSNNDDLFWAIVKTDGADQTTERQFIDSISYCVSYELNEAFSDRDGQGFIADNGCEIGDICETKATFDYRGRTVQQYWSNWDNNCIHGDQSVSFGSF